MFSAIMLMRERLVCIHICGTKIHNHPYVNLFLFYENALLGPTTMSGILKIDIQHFSYLHAVAILVYLFFFLPSQMTTQEACDVIKVK